MISSEFNQGKLVAMSLPGGVEIRCDLPNKGRGLFAARDFADDDVLFEEMPLVCSQFLWNTLYKYLACDHCMRALETAEEASRRLANSAALELPHPELCDVKKEEHVTCPHCQVLYCSSVCQEAAWAQYHRTLCMGDSRVDSNHPLNKLQEVWRNINYPPETCSIMLIARMVATVRQAKDKAGAIQSFGQFCRATVNEEEEIAHKLLGKQFQQTLELLRTLTMEALYEEDLQQWFTPEGFRSLFALIGTNGQGVGTSSISVWVSHCEECQLPEAEKELLDNFIDKLYEDLDKVSGSFLNCEGSGLYRLQSTCNHSCEPNAEVSFPHNNSTLAVKALRDIKQGEEIFICYLDYCARERSRYSRQKILRENYLFNCSCSKCQTQANDPDGTSEEEMDDDDDDDDDEEDEEVAAAGESKR